MTFQEFHIATTNERLPAGINEILQALWYAAKGNWEEAHNIAQSKEGTPAYDRLHAYLHRVEGDDWNANYWYHRAGVEMSSTAIHEEWETMVKENLE